MNLLDRYIFKSILMTSLGAVALFAMVLTLGSVMKELMSFLLAGQIDLLFFLRLTALTLIYVCGFAMPMGVLTAVLLTLGRLSADSEVTAMRASGMSLLRIARPVIVLGVLLACCSFCITSVLGPWARGTYKRELNEAIRANPLSVLVPRTFVRTFPGFVVYVGDKTGPDIRELCLWQLDPHQRVIRMIRARTAKVDYDENANDLILNLGDAIVELRDPKAPESSAKPQWVGSFGESEQIRLSLNQLFSRANAVRTKLDFLPWDELVAQRDKLALPVQGETPQQRYDRERGHAKVGIVLSERVNNALVVLSFALVAVPLGIKVSRRETSANLGLAVAIALGYFVLFTAIGWLEKMPQTMPWLLLYLPNILLLGMTWWLYARVERR